MAIYFHKTKKKWLVDVWSNGQRYKSKSFKNKALAERFERETLSELDTAKITGIQFKDLTYNEIFNIWYSSVSYRKRKTSLVKDEQMNRDFVEPVIGHLKVSVISSKSFEKIVSNMLKEDLSKSSINKVIQHFKTVFTHAFDTELIGRNPGKSFKQLKLTTKEMDFFSQEELDEFLSHSNQKYQAENRLIHVFYLTLFTTGMRLGEVLGLEWENSFDFIRNKIIINQNWSHSEKTMIETTKGKKDRTIPLPSLLKAELLLLRNKRRGPKVFSQNGVTPLDPDNIRSRNWDIDMKQSRVRRIRIHDARHTYGAMFMMSGGNIYDLSRILGHSGIKTTERYAHLSSSHLAGLRDIIQPNLTAKADVIKMNSLPIHCQDVLDSSENALCV